MSESREIPYDQLPVRVRQDMDDMRKKLGPDLILGRVHVRRGGWVAAVCLPDGTEGGQFMINAEPGELPEG